MSQNTHTAAFSAEELEADEPPEHPQEHVRNQSAGFSKSKPAMLPRRESLLTRQLHASEGESHTEDEMHHPRQFFPHGLPGSSNPSVASTAELTSDNEVTSPGTRVNTPSPPFPPSHMHHHVPLMDKIIDEEPAIYGQDEHISSPAPAAVAAPPPSQEKVLEAGLNRRRCITFACGKKEQPAAAIAKSKTESDVSTPSDKPSDQPIKRRCMLTFACPSRAAPQTLAKPLDKTKMPRHVSPAPPRSPVTTKASSRSQRPSDSTIKTESPKSVRKTSSFHRRKYSADVDDSQLEAARFHEFGTTEKVEDEWIQESTCHRSRLTIKDTLRKENIIRQLGEEVEEEEALEEDGEEEEEAELDDDELDNDDDEDNEDEEEDVDEDDDEDDGAVVSDAGFDTDDEGGFAGSDSENDSDNEWWAPGRSTAATSTDRLDYIRPTTHRKLSDSSLESARGANGPHVKLHAKHRRSAAHALDIDRPRTPELPDSTDFVCGTLDEDRPLEQAYIFSIEQRKAAKHKLVPQDIDPTFPTSDPEMDEEDEEDDDGVDAFPDESDHAPFMHGHIDMGDDHTVRRGRSGSAAMRRKSPAPSPRRLRSPPPPTSRKAHRSPAPALTHRTSHRSPAPAARKHLPKSPAPTCRLFSSSPRRRGSPAPMNRLTSPPNTRRPSVEGTPGSHALAITPNTLGQRPRPTYTASLPRVATFTQLHHASSATSANEEDEAEHPERPTRQAIDIVKGLEKKRQRRKEKLYQKHCQKAANKDRTRRPKPGQGAERMREVGLELAAYKGNRELMLSV